MRFILHWLVVAIAILIVSYVLPGVTVASFVTALIVAIVLGIINVVLKPILLILTLPITILTLGLFALVINALLVLLAAAIVPGFAVAGFWWALVFSLILSLVNGLFHSMTGE